MPPSDAFLFVELAYPDPVDPEPLISWDRAVLHIAEQPQRILARCEQRYEPSVMRHPNEQVRALAACSGPRSQEQRALVVCLGAVLQGAFVALVKHSESGEVFELKPLVWQGKALLLCHPLSLARTGRFAPAVAQLPSASLSSRLSGGALYVSKQRLARIIAEHQRASDAEMGSLMKTIIDEHEAAGNKIKQVDFLSRMKRETGGSGRQIQRFWAKVPVRLKYVHRPRAVEPKAPR